MYKGPLIHSLLCSEFVELTLRMGIDKVKRHADTGAEYVTGPDSSCLMHMQGIARRQKTPIQFIHVVQILAAGL